MPKKCIAFNCNYNVFSKDYCKIHQHLRTDDKKPKPIKAISDKRKAYKSDPNNPKEIDIFNEIWNERPHVSELSGKPLPYDKSNMAMWVCQFLHVIPKGKSPKLRYDKRNILLGTLEEHNHQDRYNNFKLRQFELLREIYGVKEEEG
jgi:hypothetical protein